MYLAEYTGLGVRIAIIDSGVHADHPHVGGVTGGLGIHEDGTLDDDFLDRLGHGTAVAAAIREKALDAEIVAIKVFWRSLATDVATLIRAIDEAAACGSNVINLSLGTADMQHRDRLQDAVSAAQRLGAIVVAANDEGGTRWLPGSLDGVVAVRADWSCDRHAYEVTSVDDRLVLTTSPYPRDIPGVSRERNVNGISFAVAYATGFVARALESAPTTDVATIFKALRTAAEAPRSSSLA